MSTRSWVLAPSITIGFILAVVLLLAAGRSGYQAQLQATEIHAAVGRDRRMIEQSHLVLTDLLDAETCQRGYLLTGADAYLKPYEDASRALPGDLATLGGLVVDSPEQRRRLADLSSATAATLDGLAGAVEVRRREGAETAHLSLLTRSAQDRMDLSRTILSELERAQRSDLDRGHAAGGDRRFLTRKAIVAETWLGTMLLGWALFALNQQTRRRILAEGEREALARAGADQAALVRTAEERARAAEAVRVRDEEFRATFVLSPLGKARVDADGRFLLVNPRLCTMTGYAEAESSLGMTWGDLTPPEDVEESLGKARYAVEGRFTQFALEKRYLRKDGVRKWAQIDTVLVQDDGGKALHTITAMQDITDRKKAEAEREDLLRLAEQALARAEQAAERSRRLIDGNVIGVLVARGARVTEANDAFLDMVGYSRADLAAGRVRWPELTPPEVLPTSERALEQLARLAQRGKDPPYEKQFLHKNGTRVPALVGAVRLEASVPEWVSFVVDLTERNETLTALRAAQKQAEAANQAKDEFLAVLSHELRSPLHAMIGWLAILRKGLASGRNAERAMETLERNVRLQAQLVNDLLDVSRIVSQKLVIEEEALDLSRLVLSAAESRRPTAEAKGVALVVSIEADTGRVLGDEQRLLQVLGNLLTNALNFTPSGGRVTVTLACQPGEAVLTVGDTGAGIAPDFLPHVFDRFRQADASRTRSQGGLGIGLAIVKTLVELHGGRVEAHSAGLGAGATFTVHLPLRAAATEPPPADTEPGVRGEAPEKPTTAALAGMTVLLVDDDADSREALRIALDHAGAHVVACASAGEARLRLTDLAPEVIVSDVGMPGESGYELIRWVRARAGDYLPAVAITGFASAQDREEAARAGFDDHLAKPVNADDLIAKIQLAVRRSGPRLPQSGVLPRTVRRSG